MMESHGIAKYGPGLAIATLTLIVIVVKYTSENRKKKKCENEIDEKEEDDASADMGGGRPSLKTPLERQSSLARKNQLQVFTDAVGGHTSKQRGPAMLRGEGVLFKPFQDAGDAVAEGDDGEGKAKRKKKLRGEMEAEFYARVWSTNHPLRIHQPAYYGVETFPDGLKYLVLEDLTYGLNKPCVLDLKMGRRSYDEDATPDKIAKEKAKYPPQEVVGFRFSGMRVYQPATGDWVQSNREWCFSLEPAQIPDALERFFFDGRSVRRQLIGSVLKQVGAIAKCLEDHPTWRMYGASLLIIYDGASGEDVVKARLIDFSHCYEIKDEGGKDYGFLHGLYFLLSSLNDLLDRGRRNLTRRGSLVDSATRLIVQSSERSVEDALTEGSNTPLQAHATLPNSTTSLAEVATTSAVAASETLEILQQDPHLAPVVRKKLSTVAGEDDLRKVRRRTRSLQDLLSQGHDGASSASGSPASSHHHRSPSTNDAISSKTSSPFAVEFRRMKASVADSSKQGSRELFSLDGIQAPASPFSSTDQSDALAQVVVDTDQLLPDSITPSIGEPSPKGSKLPPPQRTTTKMQVGGAHDNIYLSEGTIEKEEVDKDNFDTEVRFYQSVGQDPLCKVVPAFIRVDESVTPRRLILEDITSLVAQPAPAAMDLRDDVVCKSNKVFNIMDIKLGFRSFRADVSNEAKKSYYEKYLECVNGIPPERVKEVWTYLVGSPDGPMALKNKLLGKKDYLSFRDGTTTSAQYGFRLTALKHTDFEVSQEEAKTKSGSYNAFLSILERFLSSGTNGFDSELAANFIQEIDSILEAINASEVFARTEFVGSSLLFVHQGGIPAVRWIDFANVSSPPSADHNGIVNGIKKLRSMLDDLIREPQLDI